MALKKEKSVFDGQASGSYWRIVSISIDLSGPRAVYQAGMGLFSAKLKGDEGAVPLMIHTVYGSMEPDQLGKDIRAVIYETAKADPEFIGSEDA